MSERNQWSRAGTSLWACGVMLLAAVVMADAVAAQVRTASVGVRVAQAYPSVEQLGPSYDSQTGFGLSATARGLAGRFGVRLDFDRVTELTHRTNGFSSLSSSSASWMTASVSVQAFCAQVCLDGSVGLGVASLDLQNTESVGPDAPEVSVIDTRTSRALRLGAEVRLESFPYLELSLARYSAPIDLHRPGVVGQDSSFDSYMGGVTVVLPIRLPGGR